MQASGGTRGRTPGTAYHKGGGKPKLAHGRQETAGAVAAPVGNDFLKKKFVPLGPKRVVRNNWDGESFNCVTKSNYLYLKKCAVNYAKLLGKDLELDPFEMPGSGIADVYEKLSDLTDGIHLNIDVDRSTHELEFMLWSPYEWGDYSLYFLPVRFLEGLRPGMRKIATAFLNRLGRKNGMLTTNQCSDVDMLLEHLEMCLDELPSEERALEQEFISSYEKDGSVYELMSGLTADIGNYSISRALAGCKPKDEDEKKLVELMREGLRFTGDGHTSVMSLLYDHCREDEGDDSPIYADRMIRFVYEHDRLTEMLVEVLNDEMNCGAYVVYPCASLRLTPRTDKPFEMDPNIKEFYKYMDKLLDFLIDL